MPADEGPAPLTVFSDLAAATKTQNIVQARGWQECPAGAVSARGACWAALCSKPAFLWGPPEVQGTEEGFAGWWPLGGDLLATPKY